MFSDGRLYEYPCDPFEYPRDAEDGGVKVCHPGREDVIVFEPRLPLAPSNELPELPLRTPLLAPGARFVFAELGGVKVCHPEREEVTELPLLPLRGPLFVVAGRELFVGRDMLVAVEREPELNPPRDATALVPVRGAEKKCCVLDGACRYEPGSAARPVAL